jgi:hypothetical protein
MAAMRRGLRRPEDQERAALGERGCRLRARLAGAVALLLFVASVFVASPRGSWAMAEALGFRSTGAADCLRHDSRRPAGDPAGGACHLGGLCCAAGFDGSAPVDSVSARLPASRLQPATVRQAYDAREDFLALAGWASSWSSRAPPRGL